MKENPLLSVIVPVYKVEEYLAKCLDSIVNQTYKNLEIILIDDGSPDTCPQICDEYEKKDNRIKVIHKENGGVSSARNMGLDIAKGEFITFCDSDDWLDETMYEKMIAKQQEQDLDLIFARYNNINNGRVVKINELDLDKFCKTNDLKYFINVFAKTIKECDVYKKNNYIMSGIWRMIFKRNIIGQIRFNKDIKFMEDSVFIFEIMLTKNAKCGYVDEYLYNYIVRGASATGTKGNIIVNNSLAYEKKVIELFKKTPYEQIIKARLFTCYFDCVECKYRYGYNIDLSLVKHLNSQENYKQLMKMDISFKRKVMMFCVHHGLFFIFKLKGLLKK